MPELPEVERYRRLAEAAVDRSIAWVVTPDPWFLKAGTTATALYRALVGHRITAARRIGKLLLLDTSGGSMIGVRFGMTGSLLVDGVPGLDQMRYAPTRYHPGWDRCAVRFSDGGALVVHDPRRLGGVTLDPDLSHLGADALTVTPAELAAGLGGSSAPLKARLLDQSKVAGIGNLIADEVLWRSGLSPLRPANSLSAAEIKRLHHELAPTIEDLMQRGGSDQGDLNEQRRVHGRCPKDGATLVRSNVGSRTSWWCPKHQA